MVVSLYTSRIVLNVLGVEDFGLYNVVGGFVTMFGFLNSAMASATQRFLAYEIGRNDTVQLRNVFSMSINIHVIIGVIVFVIAETIGLWFVNNMLSIPSDRLRAINWVYQLSVFALLVNIINVPFNAMIVANERMSVFAWISIIEVSLKLAIVFMLLLFGNDKLIFYSILIFCVTLIITLSYVVYCNRKFSKVRYKVYWNKSLYKTLTSFSFWSIWGSLSWVMMGQGLNVILNVFFGPVVNAARGIAFQVNAMVAAFVNNFRMAVNPQIIKSFSSGEINDMNNLAIESAKYSFFLLLLISLPVFLETELILRLWLKNVPEYTIIFCQLILINTIIHTCDISIIFSARGRIRENQLFGGLIYLLILPVSYFLLSHSFQPESVFIVQIIATIIVDFGVNLILLKRIANINISNYMNNLIFPVFRVSVVALIAPILLVNNMNEGIPRLLSVIILSTISILLTVYLIGINNQTRTLINKKVISMLKR